VEIHDPRADSPGTPPTFKWSRDNGSVVFPIEEFVPGLPAQIRLTQLGRDEALGLRELDWVEVVDDAHELADQRVELVQVRHIDRAERLVTVTPWAAPSGGFDGTGHPRLRRWDQEAPTGPGALPATSGPIDLEDGIRVRFRTGTCRAGTTGSFPARTVLPALAGPSNAPPEGIVHHYCRLAIITWTANGGALTSAITDCRDLFPPLTDVCAEDVCVEDTCVLGVDTLQEVFDAQCRNRLLRYVTGDGQTGAPARRCPARSSSGWRTGSAARLRTRGSGSPSSRAAARSPPPR
jgi:hypothetical protein